MDKKAKALKKAGKSIKSPVKSLSKRPVKSGIRASKSSSKANSSVKYTFRWDIETEAQRVLQASFNTANGFYLAKGFYVSEKRFNGDPGCIYLPPLNFKRFKGYWDRVAMREMQFPILTPMDMEDFLEEQLTPYLKMDNKKLKTFEAQWKKVEGKFWETIWNTFPEFKGLIGELEICITSFGSLSSYGHLNEEKNQKLRVYLREDFGISQIAEVIITALFRKVLNEKGFTWETQEGITDFLMQTTVLNKLFPDYKPTLESLVVDLVKKSESVRYLNEIGVPNQFNLEIKSGDLWYANQNVEKNFTKSQAAILKLMMNRRSEIISFDDLSDMIWEQKSTDKYSIWAINKHMQRLKDKLGELQIHNISIESVRGRGYILT